MVARGLKRSPMVKKLRWWYRWQSRQLAETLEAPAAAVTMTPHTYPLTHY